MLMSSTLEAVTVISGSCGVVFYLLFHKDSMLQ